MSRRSGPRAGFTLIEIMVALVVLAVVMLAAQRGMVAARLGLDRAQSTVAAEAVARSILETELGRLAPAPGVVSGVTDGLDWTVTAEAVVLPLPPAPPPKTAIRTAGAREAAPAQEASAPDDAATDKGPAAKWRTLRVVVSVANGRGRPLSVETIHLAKAP